MRHRTVMLLRTAAGVVVLAIVVWRLGTGPFLRGLRSIDAGSVLAALAITAACTVLAAWRWRCVATRLGATLGLGEAVAAYYRSQLVNLTVPGGVLGDVDRAVGHGHRTGQLGVAARAVVWERAGGQWVQAVVTVAVLVAVPSPLRPPLPVVLLAAAVVIVVAVVLAAAARRSSRPPVRGVWHRALSTARRDVRRALLARRAWPVVATTSLLAVTGHVAIMLIAAHRAAPSAAPARVLPLAVLVLAASAIPLHVLGWGPREGVAAWVFGAAGIGAGAGVETATVYGILALASCLPGVAVLVVDWCRRDRPAAARPLASAPRRPAWHGGVHG